MNVMIARPAPLARLIAAADAAPDDLYPEGDGKFEFERTVSRLLEMQSEDYLAEGHGPR
jgi:cell division protein ZapE